MTQDRAQQIVNEAVKEYTSKEFTMDSTIDDLDVDSLELIQVVLNIEDRVQIKIADDVVEGFETVGDIVRCLESYDAGSTTVDEAKNV